MSERLGWQFSVSLFLGSILFVCGFLSSNLLGEENRAPKRLREGWSSEIERAWEAGDGKRALELVEEAVSIAPNQSSVYLVRGMVRFRMGDIEGSVVDFDRSIELAPKTKPSCWQRGISLYYLGRYQEGIEQFEIHRTVNPNDVENAFWHFMCVAKLDGVESARKRILPTGNDTRFPLMEIYRLIRGEKSLESIAELVADPKGGPRTRLIAEFYGNLYLGLYLDVLGDREAVEGHLQRAIETGVGGYMADVAKIHLERK